MSKYEGSHVFIYVEDDSVGQRPDLMCVHCGAMLDGSTETPDLEWLQQVKDFSATHATCKRTSALHFPSGFDPDHYIPSEPTP